MFFWTTIESQMDNNGTFGLLYNYYTDYNDALARLYTILAAAAVSTVPYHAAYILRSDGAITEGRVFDRRSQQTPENNQDIPEE